MKRFELPNLTSEEIQCQQLHVDLAVDLPHSECWPHIILNIFTGDSYRAVEITM